MSPTRFPWLPMLALAICLLGDMYISSSLFSYVGYMVQALGVVNSKDEAGYYVGFLASASMLGRFSTSYLWGRFADRYGRLMVIYIGLVSTAVFSVAFGLSTTFWWALGCRILLGAMSGIMGISKTMVSEVCSKENEAVGMGVITASWSLSLVLGPGVAGLLTEPARNFPRVFSDSGLFGRYPCLLPNLVGAGVALMGLLLVILFLSETANLEESSVALVNRISCGDWSSSVLVPVRSNLRPPGDAGAIIQPTAKA